ncbi:hypothetical protein [Chondromyces apiculatus]|nr:hypothetical protein [Chondromyces apiculatus]
MRISLLFPVTLLTLLPLACGGSDQPDPNDPSNFQGQNGQYQAGQYPAGQYGQQQPGYGQQQPGYGQTTTPQPQTTAAPTQPGLGGILGGQSTSSGGTATAIAPAAAAAATPIMTALAASEVQGMAAEGGSFAAQFQDGQTFEQAFNIQPGKCYSVIAAGVGMQNLSIQIVAQQAPLPAVTLAQSNTSGPNATLGGKGQCFKNPLPIGGPAKVVLRSQGAGMAIAQIYVK